MSTITKVRVWNDCGFTNNAIEVPSIDSQLPQPSFIIDGPLNTNTPDLFSKLSVVESYRDLMNASYIEVSINWNNGHPEQIFYGWVDAVNLKSDTDGFPQTEVYWHVDLWRTYLSQAKFGYGMVNRRPLKQDDSIPPQPYPYRYRKVEGDVINLTDADDIWWVFISVDHKLSAGDVQNAVYMCFPISTANATASLKLSGGSSAPSAFDVFTGNWDEKLQLTPETIKSAFISPYPPNKFTGDGVSSPISLLGWWIASNHGYYSMNSPDSCIEVTKDLPRTIMTDDVHRFIIQGFDGETVGELPWGIPVSHVRVRTVLASTSAYIQIRTNINGHSDGTCWTVPLIPLELTQNSWSSYVYSGSRQADMDQRVLNADVAKHDALQGVVMGATGNILGGAVGGFMSGAGPIGGALGAVAGLAGSAVSAISAKATYDYRVGEVADREQAIADYRASMQPNGLIMSGTGFDAIKHGRGIIAIVDSVTDDYSQQVRADDIERFGVHVSEPTADCSQLVREGGGLQITNLIVKGDIPVEAKRYIKQRLASGVRIV